MSNNSNDNKSNRITGKIQVGERYVLPIEQSKVTKSQAKVQQILEETDAKAQQIVAAAENRSQIVIETANNEATRIIEEARQRAQSEYDTIKRQGYEEGFKKGEEDGLEKFKTDAVNSLKALETLSNSTFEMKKNIIDSATRDIVDLVSVIADKVCHTQINIDTLYDITVDAIKQLNDKEHITIIVSPKLVDYIQELAPDFRDAIPAIQSLKILEDSSLSADGVIVETPAIRLDSRISVQIAEIARNMLLGADDELEQE